MNKEQAQEEVKKIQDWVFEEEDRVCDRLKREGRYMEGLDGQHEEFAYIYAERNRRIQELKNNIRMEDKEITSS